MLNIELMEQRRRQIGLTQQQAAESAGLGGRSRWCDIASGKRTNIQLETLAAIAKALSIDPRELIKPPAAKEAKHVKRNT